MAWLQRPTERRDWLVNSLDQASSTAKHRAEDRLGRRKPVAELRLVAPRLHTITVFDHAAAPAELLDHPVELRAPFWLASVGVLKSQVAPGKTAAARTAWPGTKKAAVRQAVTAVSACREPTDNHRGF